ASAGRSIGDGRDESAPTGNSPSMKRTSLKRLPVTAISASISTVYAPKATRPAMVAWPGCQEREKMRCSMFTFVVLYCLVDLHSSSYTSPPPPMPHPLSPENSPHHCSPMEYHAAA